MLKIAKSLNIPRLVIFRDPLESMASCYFHLHDGKSVNHKEQTTVNWMAREWTDYYSFVLDNRKNLKLVSLECFRNKKINEEIGRTHFSWSHDVYNRS